MQSDAVVLKEEDSKKEDTKKDEPTKEDSNQKHGLYSVLEKSLYIESQKIRDCLM